MKATFDGVPEQAHKLIIKDQDDFLKKLGYADKSLQEMNAKELKVLNNKLVKEGKYLAFMKGIDKEKGEMLFYFNLVKDGKTIDHSVGVKCVFAKGDKNDNGTSEERT